MRNKIRTDLKEATEKLDSLNRKIYELKFWCGYEFPILVDICDWLGKYPDDDAYFHIHYLREDLRNKYGPKDEQSISVDWIARAEQEDTVLEQVEAERDWLAKELSWRESHDRKQYDFEYWLKRATMEVTKHKAGEEV